MEYPPLTSADEEMALVDESFAKRCEAHVIETGLEYVTINRFHTTDSAEWGSLARADFEINNETSGYLVNRIVCWEDKALGMVAYYAFGQAIPPLR